MFFEVSYNESETLLSILVYFQIEDLDIQDHGTVCARHFGHMEYVVATVV